MPVGCREYRDALIEAARSGGAPMAPGLRRHMESCPGCGRFFEDQSVLTAALDCVAAQPMGLGSAAEGRVLAEFDRARAPLWRWVAAACLALIACLGAAWSLRRPPVTPPARARAFLTIPYTVPLAPREPAAIFRTRIPVAELVAAGFHIETPDLGAVIEADVLVSQDGRARAIRPVSIAITN